MRHIYLYVHIKRKKNHLMKTNVMYMKKVFQNRKIFRSSTQLQLENMNDFLEIASNKEKDGSDTKLSAIWIVSFNFVQMFSTFIT